MASCHPLLHARLQLSPAFPSTYPNNQENQLPCRLNIEQTGRRHHKHRRHFAALRVDGWRALTPCSRDTSSSGGGTSPAARRPGCGGPVAAGRPRALHAAPQQPSRARCRSFSPPAARPLWGGTSASAQSTPSAFLGWALPAQILHSLAEVTLCTPWLGIAIAVLRSSCKVRSICLQEGIGCCTRTLPSYMDRLSFKACRHMLQRLPEVRR